MKTNHAAQEELIKLQKIELEKANLRVEQLVKSGIECQKRFAASLSCLEAENKKLRASAENATRERDIARIEINEHLLESRRQNDEYGKRLFLYGRDQERGNMKRSNCLSSSKIGGGFGGVKSQD